MELRVISLMGKSNMRRFWLILPILFLINTLFVGCTSQHQTERATRLAMGTYVEVTVSGEHDNLKRAINAVFDEIKHIEDISSFHKSSALTELNSQAGKGLVIVDPELFTLIEGALEVSQVTDGAYDPTVGVLTKLWNFSGSEEPRIPEPAEITQALNKVGFKKVQLNPEERKINLPEEGMALDLGGYTKGYALNQAKKVLEKYNIKSALINMGGDILALGYKSGNTPWRIGVENPRDKASMLAVVELADRMIFTSGDYERFFMKNGTRYHHILNPKTGYPAERLSGTSLVGPPGNVIQPFGTALFVVGPGAASEFLKHVPDIYGMFIDPEGKTYFTEGAQSIFKVK